MASERGRDRDPWEEELDEEVPTDPQGFFPDLLRKGLTLGFTGFFMTEEALRKALGDSAPREMIDFVLQQSEKTRTELLENLSREFGRSLQALDPVELARRLLDGRTIEVSAKVRFVPEDKEGGGGEGSSGA